MMFKKKILVLIPVVFLAGCPAYVSVYEKLYTTEQIRYKIEISVDSPQGVRSGSGVWGYKLVPRLDPVFGFFGNGFSFSSDIEGEAIQIDLGDGRSIYALLGGNIWYGTSGSASKWFSVEDKSSHYSSGVPNVLPALAYFNAGYEKPLKRPYGESKKIVAHYEVNELKKLTGIKVDLDCSRVKEPLCPFMVVMSDPADQTSIIPIDFQNMQRDLGSNYRLVNSSLTITNEPVSHYLKNKMPWLFVQFGRQLSEGCLDANNLECNGFVREARK